MKVAVAQRPVEQFDTQLTLPDWQLEPDDIANMANPDGYVVPDDGSGTPAPARDPADNGPAASPDFLDQATGRQGDNQPAARATTAAAPQKATGAGV
jgi:penicillin-binding protein 1A